MSNEDEFREVTKFLIALCKFSRCPANARLTANDFHAIECPARKLDMDVLKTKDGRSLVMAKFEHTFGGIEFEEQDGELVPTDKDADKVIHVYPWLRQEARRIGAQVMRHERQWETAKSVEREWDKYRQMEKYLLMTPLKCALNNTIGSVPTTTNLNVQQPQPSGPVSDVTSMLDTVPDDILLQQVRKRKLIDLSTDDDFTLQADGSGKGLQNLINQQQQYAKSLVKVKKEKAETEESLAEAKDDCDDTNELVQQQTLTVDIWQGRFDEVAKLAEAAGVDIQQINAIRHRSLSSGR
mmetsp:Transcript_20927/g.60015  ORF Transcript_20927/g.60015 Transcript_20927/m.60015 type:complete len:296 (+) Transcript_20927:123-1010(+)